MSNLQPQTRAWTSSSESEDWHDIPSDLDSSSAARPVDINHHVQASLVDQDVQASIVDLNPVIPPGGEQQHTDSPSSGVLVASEKKKCWICLAEEGEAFIDGSPINTSRWSKACACSLDAHENCLITWINQSRGGDANKAMTCPQCKEQYRLRQSVSRLYKLACHYNKRIDRIVPYLAGLGAIGGTYCALTIHGWYALCTFCGDDLAIRLFSDENWSRPSYIVRMLFGMQFIPIWLLASRTKYLDSILPFIPLAFIEQDNLTLYPHPRVTLFPTPRYETLPPALTMCLLPWFRIVYNKLWDKLVLPWEKKWEGTLSIGESDEYGALWRPEDNIRVEWERDDVGVQAGNVPAPARRNHNVDHPPPPEDMEDVLLTTNLTTLCRKVVGAMLLPDTCSFAGWAIGQIPWVKRKIPDRFSRNVIGGIVFLVLKDAASVWFKYSAAKSRRSLRVLDYDGRRGPAPVR